MAKKTRIDRRGKIRSLVKPKRPAQPHHWKKAKAIGMYLNRRQAPVVLEQQYLITESGDFLTTEAGDFLIVEL